MEAVIREAAAGDVEGIIEYMRALTGEEGLYIGFEPGEFAGTVDGELRWLEEHARENSVVLLAVMGTDEGRATIGDDRGEKAGGEREGEIVGLLNCLGGNRRGCAHETTLGVSVKAGWRDQGIGRRLMERALEWARESGVVTRVQLEVLAENVRARKLYEELGFEVEGVRRRAWRRWGRWMDSVVMGKILVD